MDEDATARRPPRGGRRQVEEILAEAARERPGAGLTAAQLAYRLDLHVTTVRFHLERLVDGGRLTTYEVRGGGVGRPAKAYALAGRGAGESGDRAARDAPTPYELLAGLLVEALATPAQERRAQERQGQAPAPEPVAAGRRWAAGRLGVAPVSWPEAVTQVRSLLEEWGYAVGPDRRPPPGRGADVPPDAVEFTVGACPFEDLARAHPQVVCAVHRGLMEGALDGLEQGVVRVELEPFVTPTTCRVRLARAGP